MIAFFGLQRANREFGPPNGSTSRLELHTVIHHFPSFTTLRQTRNVVASCWCLTLLATIVVGQLRAPRAADSEHEEIPWRRTADGWENANNWRHLTSARQPQLPMRSLPLPHPLTFAALQILLSVGALVAFSSNDDVEQTLRKLARRRG